MPGQNALLAALPPDEYERLQAGMRLVSLGAKRSLHASHSRNRYVYFPLTGMVCVAAPVGSGKNVEVGLVGNEGLAGLPMSLANGSTPLVETVQAPVTALRLPAGQLELEYARNAPLAAILRRYTRAFMVMLAQSVACGKRHRIEQRCARWLLMVDDRLGPGSFALTHQNLAQMIAVRRASVSEVAEKLQDRGLIRYSRGMMAVVSRPALEKLSCECYRTIRREYDRLLLARSQAAV